MSLVRPMGPLEDLDVDADELECQHPSTCPRDPVARVPNPNEVAAAGLDLCPVHLAIWLDERDLDVGRDVQELAAAGALLELEDAPPWTTHNGEQWSRLGIDHHGEAHYYRERDDDTARILILDERLDVVDVKRVPRNRKIADWIEFVRRRRGWMRLDPDARVAHEGGEDVDLE